MSTQTEEQTTTVIAPPPVDKSNTLVAKFARHYGVEAEKLLHILKVTAFKQRGDVEVSNEQMAALLIVADQHGLNPFTKEIFAFSDKGAIVPVVSVDGWARIINEHPAFDGMDFAYAEKTFMMPRGKICPEWCEVTIHRKDRTRPTIVREYLDEVYQEPRGQGGGYDGPWQTHTKRFLRHKTLIQGARIAFGFAGIYDEDEASRIVDAQAIRDLPAKRAGPTTIDNAAAPRIEAEKVAGRPSRLAALMATQAMPKREPVPVAVGRDDGAPPFDGPYAQAAE